MSTTQGSVACIIPSMRGDIEPLMWGRDPMPPGPIAEWNQMFGLGNQEFEFIFTQDANTMNEMMSAGSATGKSELIANEHAYSAMTLQNRSLTPAAGDSRNPFANIGLGNRVPEIGQASATGAGARSARGRGRGKKTSMALVPRRGGTVVASPIQGSGRFSFH